MRTKAARVPGAVIVVLMACILSGAGEDCNTMFYEANTLYKEEKYDEAARKYQEILASGVSSGAIHYNLGNAYFKAGKLGLAVAHYLAAERLLPRDPDIRANLEYARTLVQDGTSPGGFWLFRFLLLPGRLLDPDELAVVCSMAYFAAMLALTARTLVASLKRAGDRIASVMGILLLILLVSAGHKVYTEELTLHGVITQAELPARYEPAEDGTVYFTLYEGTEVRVLKQDDVWCQVKRTDGRSAWVKKQSLYIF